MQGILVNLQVLGALGNNTPLQSVLCRPSYNIPASIVWCLPNHIRTSSGPYANPRTQRQAGGPSSALRSGGLAHVGVNKKRACVKVWALGVGIGLEAMTLLFCTLDPCPEP